MILKSIVKKVIRSLGSNHHLRNDFVRYGDLILPPMRMRKCTEEFKENQYFLASANNEVQRLIEHCCLSTDSRIFEIGCGPGRLPIGIISTLKNVQSYEGIDVDNQSISWCKKYIEEKYPNFHFTYLDVYNERYNPRSTLRLNDDFTFPFYDEYFNIIYLYSVFTHMEIEDIKVYLREFRRILHPTGKIFLTAYIEDNVPDVVSNPPGYRDYWSGPLHRVRYNKDFFSRFVAKHGFSIERLDYATEHDCQTAVYLIRS